MSEIETGCKAMIINGFPDDIGKIVKALSFIGSDDDEYGVTGDDLWEVDTELTVCSCDDPLLPDGKTFLENAKNMQRIDDHDTSLIKSKEELTTLI